MLIPKKDRKTTLIGRNEIENIKRINFCLNKYSNLNFLISVGIHPFLKFRKSLVRVVFIINFSLNFLLLHMHENIPQIFSCFFHIYYPLSGIQSADHLSGKLERRPLPLYSAVLRFALVMLYLFKSLPHETQWVEPII